MLERNHTGNDGNRRTKKDEELIFQRKCHNIVYDVYKRQNQECYVRSGLSEGDRVLNQNVLLVYNSLNAD